MKRPSLLRQLVGIHVAVVAASCLVLAAAAGLVAAHLLRLNQDRSLMDVANSLCHDVRAEQEELETDILSAARETFGETNLPRLRVEFVGRDGAVHEASGTLAGWSSRARVARPGRCVTEPSERVDEASPSFRACLHECGAETGVRVVAADVLSRVETRIAAIGLLAGLPIAAIGGWLVGSVLFLKKLGPLAQLREAAARLQPGPGLELGVKARAAELADLEQAFNGVLAGLGEALTRERRFSQEASHELRTPLTALRGRLERMGLDPVCGDEARAEVAAALAEVSALDHLTEELLLLARSESAPFSATPVNLCDLARDAAHRRARLDGPGIPSPEVDAPDEILVAGSEDLLAHAIDNLLENARKYAGPMARIRIRLAEETGEGVVFVEDDGPGIPDELRPYVFESFVRGPTDRNRVPGAGLGLAFVRAVVRRHRGHVSTRRGALGGEELRIAMPLLPRSPAGEEERPTRGTS